MGEVCTRCVMDSTDPNITFDAQGIAITAIPFMTSAPLASALKNTPCPRKAYF